MFLTLSSFSDTVSKVRRLNNRLEKKGLPLITYKAEEKNMSFAEIFPQYALPKHYGEIRIDVVDFSFTSDFEKFQLETGWEFIAVIDHNEGLIHAFVEGVDVEKFRNRSVCDHCGTKRNRSKTVILRKGEELIQVGTKCLSEFFQKDVNELVRVFELFTGHEVPNDPAEYLSGGGSISNCHIALERILELAVASIQKHGYCPSSDPCSTKRVVTDSIFGGNLHVEAKEEDKETALKVLEWMKGLEKNVSCFQTNLRQIADNGFTTVKNFGYVCYAPVAYFKELAEKAEKAENPSEYYGNIGDKVELEMTLVSKNEAQTSFGYKCYHTFKDSEGHTFVWGTSSRPRMSIGNSYKVKATIKEHSEFKSVKQTYLVRVKEI